VKSSVILGLGVPAGSPPAATAEVIQSLICLVRNCRRSGSLHLLIGIWRKAKVEALIVALPVPVKVTVIPISVATSKDIGVPNPLNSLIASSGKPRHARLRTCHAPLVLHCRTQPHEKVNEIHQHHNKNQGPRNLQSRLPDLFA